jgi:molecular chaperone DnaK (HSP70)
MFNIAVEDDLDQLMDLYRDINQNMIQFKKKNACAVYDVGGISFDVTMQNLHGRILM